jgi:hypothetical protein
MFWVNVMCNFSFKVCSHPFSVCIFYTLHLNFDMRFHLCGPFLYWLPFNHSFLRLFFMVTTIDQIFMSDHLHRFGTKVLCFQKWPLLSGCGGTESLNLPDVAGCHRTLCNAIVFVMLLDLAISIHKWESTVSCNPYQWEHPTLKERSYHLGYLFIFPPGPGQLSSTFSLAYTAFFSPRHPHISLLYLVLAFSPLHFLFFCIYQLLFGPSCTNGTSLLPSLFTSV